MDRSNTKTLLDKYLTGKCTPEEKKQVEVWLEKTGRKEEWSAVNGPEARKQYMAGFYQDVANIIEKQQTRERLIYHILGRAAVAIIMLILFLLFLYWYGPF